MAITPAYTPSQTTYNPINRTVSPPAAPSLAQMTAEVAYRPLNTARFPMESFIRGRDWPTDQPSMLDASDDAPTGRSALEKTTAMAGLVVKTAVGVPLASLKGGLVGIPIGMLAGLGTAIITPLQGLATAPTAFALKRFTSPETKAFATQAAQSWAQRKATWKAARGLAPFGAAVMGLAENLVMKRAYPFIATLATVVGAAALFNGGRELLHKGEKAYEILTT